MNKRKRHERIDAIDRLGTRYQQARLHARAMRERLTAALVARSHDAIREAHMRLRSAAAWESRTEQRFLSAALYAHAPLDRQVAARRAA